MSNHKTSNEPANHEQNQQAPQGDGFLDLKTYINAAEVRNHEELDDSLDKHQSLQGNNNFVSNTDNLHLSYQAPPGMSEKQEQELLDALRKQNVKLREGLKSLNEQLSKLLSKKKVKKVQEPPKALPGRPAEKPSEEQKLYGELDGAKKQLITYQNELKYFKTRYDEANNHNKYYQLEDKVAEYDKKIEELTKENKDLQTEIREKARQVDHFQDSAIVNPKESVLGDGLIAMKERLRELEQNQENHKKAAQNKMEYINKVEEALRKVQQDTQEVIQRTGFSEQNLLDLTKTKSVPRRVINKTQPALKISAVSWKSRDTDLDTNEFNQENFMKIQNDVQILQKATDVRDKTRNADLIGLSNQLNEAEEARLKVETHLEEKEKELDLLDQLYQELNDLANQYGLHPSNQEKKGIKLFKAASADKSHKVLPPNSRDPSEIHDVSITNRSDVPVEDVKTDERGKKAKTQDEGDFNDNELIEGLKPRICGIRVWHDGKRLNGIQAIYRGPDGSKIEGEKNVKDAYKYKATKFDMADDDYLREFSGFMNSTETAIDCLIFKSFLGETRKVGKAAPTSKLFKFDIQTFEYPSSIYGSIRDGEEGTVLSRIGVTIASEKASKNHFASDEQLDGSEKGSVFNLSSNPGGVGKREVKKRVA